MTPLPPPLGARPTRKYTRKQKPTFEQGRLTGFLYGVLFSAIVAVVVTGYLAVTR